MNFAVCAIFVNIDRDVDTIIDNHVVTDLK